MNCKEFKDTVICLFDTEVDSDTKAACEKHIAECARCREYYSELRETFNELAPKTEMLSADVNQSQETIHLAKEYKDTRKVKNTSTTWMYKCRKYAAAVTIFAIGVAVGWSHLFSSDAIARNSTPATILNQGIHCVQNVGNFQMDIYARTLPLENFQHLDEKADYIKIGVKLLRQNGQTLYRVEKEGGRTVVCDGKNQYMWYGNTLVKGEKEANFLERFNNIIYPEKLLAMQYASMRISEKNQLNKTETDSTLTVVTESYEKDIDMQQLFDAGEMNDCKVIMENIFSKPDGLLRSMKIYIENHKGKRLVLYCNNILYNTSINTSSITALPDINECISTHPNTISDKARLGMLQRENAQQAAQRIVNSIISGRESEAAEALYAYKGHYSNLHNEFKGSTASNFVVKQDKSYAGTYVFYALKTKDKTEKRYIAIRNDNEQHIWVVDGGL